MSRAVQRPSQVITAVGAVVFLALLTEGRPWRLFDRGGFTSDFYDVQARSLLRGRLSVPADVAGIEGFVSDGSTYLYFGPTLAIARIPTALFGSWADGRLTRLSMLVAFVVLCTVTFRLVLAVAGLLGTQAPRPWQPALVVTAVAASPVVLLASWPAVYQETELWAAALMVLALAMLAELVVTPTRALVVRVSATVLVVVMTRASIGLGAAVASVLVAVMLARHGRRRLAGWLAGGALAGVGSHFLLTFMKLGAFDLPADRQVATLVDAERAAWFAGNGNSFFRLDFIPTTLVHYFRPDGFDLDRLFPFVTPPATIDVLGAYPLETYTPTASMTATTPALVVLSVVGVASVLRGRHWSVLPFITGAAVAAGPALAIGFVASRYLVDLLPGLVVLTTVAVLQVVPGLLDQRPRWAIGGAVLVAAGAATNLLLAVGTIGLLHPGFHEARHRLDQSVFGGAAHRVVMIEDIPSAEGLSVGVLGIAGACDGLYVSDAISWQAIERRAGVLRLQVSVDPVVTSSVLTGASGHLTLERTGDRQLEVAFSLPDGQRFAGTTMWSGEPVSVEVVSDPWASGLLRGLYVIVDDEIVVRDLFVTPALGGLEPGEGVEVTVPAEEGVPVCRALLDRGLGEDR